MHLEKDASFLSNALELGNGAFIPALRQGLLQLRRARVLPRVAEVTALAQVITYW
jgi:DNA-binding phage protein